VSRNFITDGTDKKIEVPYGIAVNPETREIFVTDAKDYVNPGRLYCFTPDGKKKWEVTTGDIPAHIVFTRKRLKGRDEV
jgi:DNA-binding beta-propeller fold protein YncE